mgnify:FL=1
MEDKPQVIAQPVIITPVTPTPLPENAATTTQKVTTIQENVTSAKASQQLDQSVTPNRNMIQEVVMAIIAVSITLAAIYVSIKQIDSELIKSAFFLIAGYYFRGIVDKITGESKPT